LKKGETKKGDNKSNLYKILRNSLSYKMSKQLTGEKVEIYKKKNYKFKFSVRHESLIIEDW